ncbi:MAG: alpha/beta hydrolase [Caldilineaceae bacterium]|nr:alpha/beta hydrolase [Caldilineaceae bacterium]
MSTQFMQRPEGRIAYDDQGAGPLIICLPSMGDLRGEYRFLIPPLVAAGYRVVSMDVRGHGESSVKWSNYAVDAIGSDLLALIRLIDAGPAYVIGTSMAAGATVWATAEAPELIAGMVLIGPFVRGEGSWLMNTLFTLFLMRPWGPTMWGWYYKLLYPTQKPADFGAYQQALRANLREAGRLEALLQMIRASKAVSGARVGKVIKPALVLMGSKDPDFTKPEAEARQLAEQLQGRYTMIEGAGHYPHAEMPTVTAPLIINFLHSLREPAQVAHGA